MPKSSPKHFAMGASLGAILGATLLLGACGSDTTGPSPATTPFYWQLQLNHHAVTLATVAPYDTVRLVATPRDVHGTPIATTARPVYTVSDTTIRIDSTGLVHVQYPGASVFHITVVAALTVGGTHPLTLQDTAVVNVIAWNSASAVPQMDSLVFRPVVGDSARRPLIDMAAQISLQRLDSVQAKTATGTPIRNAVIVYRSSDTTIASFVNPVGTSTTAPQIKSNAPGVVLLTAEATIYGRHHVDSLWYTVGYPLRVICSYGAGEGWLIVSPQLPANSLSLGDLVVGQGGAVLWGNSTHGMPDDSLDIQFDDTTGIVGLPTAATFPGVLFISSSRTVPPGPGGNIPPFPAAVLQSNLGIFHFKGIVYDATTSKARMFIQPGTYHWSSVKQGIAGTVTVVSNDSLRPPTATSAP
jgi:hypothetical protein